MGFGGAQQLDRQALEDDTGLQTGSLYQLWVLLLGAGLLDGCVAWCQISGYLGQCQHHLICLAEP